MTGLLLDTNVISMFAPTKVAQNKAFADWLEKRETHEGVFLSAVTIHEIVKGAELLRARGATAKAKLVDAFLQEPRPLSPCSVRSVQQVAYVRPCGSRGGRDRRTSTR